MKLNLGSGEHPTPEGWTSFDVNPEYTPDILGDVLDLSVFPDASIDTLYGGHLCEHIPLALLAKAFAEWRRVLKPGGVLMLVGPDIDRAIQQRVGDALYDAIKANGGPPQGHSWTCSEIVLRHFLEVAGWTVEPIRVCDVRSPEWPNIAPDAAWQYALRAT
jgi:predicted SAM-dependent methyltransferase